MGTSFYKDLSGCRFDAQEAGREAAAGCEVHSTKQTWNLKGGPLKRTAVHNGPLVRFYANLAECSTGKVANNRGKCTFSSGSANKHCTGWIQAYAL